MISIDKYLKLNRKIGLTHRIEMMENGNKRCRILLKVQLVDQTCSRAVVFLPVHRYSGCTRELPQILEGKDHTDQADHTLLLIA